MRQQIAARGQRGSDDLLWSGANAHVGKLCHYFIDLKAHFRMIRELRLKYFDPARKSADRPALPGNLRGLLKAIGDAFPYVTAVPVVATITARCLLIVMARRPIMTVFNPNTLAATN